jgi:hypothetical protein
MYTIEVIYQNSYNNQGYTYKVDNRVKVVAGDIVVVPVSEDYIFKVAKVKEVHDKPKLKDNIKYRYIVAKVDMSVYYSLIKIESSDYITDDIKSIVDDMQQMNKKYLELEQLADFYEAREGFSTPYEDDLYDILHHWAIKQPEIQRVVDKDFIQPRLMFKCMVTDSDITYDVNKEED